MNETTLKLKIRSKTIGMKLCVCLSPGNHMDCQYLVFRSLEGTEEKLAYKPCN